MKTLNEIFTEEQVTEMADKILKATIEKTKDELGNTFYSQMQNYLYEIYDNISNDIHEKLIKEITEEFISGPVNYKFLRLRQKLFNENKELLIKTLTDEAIEKSVEDVIEKYTHRDYHFNWRWKDAIVRVISENWHIFQSDERVNTGLLRQIETLKGKIAKLEAEIYELNNIEP